MSSLQDVIEKLAEAGLIKAVISKGAAKEILYRKITVEKKDSFYHVSKYTEKQVFHENKKESELYGWLEELLAGDYRQLNAWSTDFEFHIMVSKKGQVTLRKKKLPEQLAADFSHNRKKKYLLNEGEIIPPLIDMGIFTSEGKVVSSMQDKFRQINRFLELVDDAVKDRQPDCLRIIDFGCGKSYLTFILYYYLTEIRKVHVDMTGLDLKEEVIQKCNAAAQRYGYENLHFERGDINGYECSGDIDMVVTLHACDTATDYALYNAVMWNAKMIFSVPCCQHEVNGQLRSENLALLTRYGIVKERFSALLTDAVRANLLEVCGYKTQLLEFVDFSHTPKNILIRAEKRTVTPRGLKQKALLEVKAALEEFQCEPALYRLLKDRISVLL